jgi:hypothetical protein
MSRPKTKPAAVLIDDMLGEASWLISHAQALGDYGRYEEEAAERLRAACAEEQAASLLEADGQNLEAAIHRVSAASCFEKLGQYTRAVTLLSAALSVELHEDYHAKVEQQRARCLAHVAKELARTSKRRRRKQPAGR